MDVLRGLDLDQAEIESIMKMAAEPALSDASADWSYFPTWTRRQLSESESWQSALEDDSMPQLALEEGPSIRAVQVASSRSQLGQLELERASPGTGSSAVDEHIFPNAFKVSGIKHICDNALAGILDQLPQQLGSIHIHSNLKHHHYHHVTHSLTHQTRPFLIFFCSLVTVTVTVTVRNRDKIRQG